jgi:hypothetical protein
MRLRELKETAHQQFVRGKFSQCAQTYQQVLRLAPRDPNMHVRHAEACRRAGDRQQAIASYRTAAELLLELGCESRARGALKAALELDPRDQFLQEVVARLGSQHEEPFSPEAPESRDELPMLPPLESGLGPVPPLPAAPHIRRAAGSEESSRVPALPPIHRVVPAAQSAAPLGPPVLLPSPVRSQTPLPRPAATASLTPRSIPTAAPVSSAQPGASLPPRSATAGTRAQAPRPAAPPMLTPLPVTTGIQASASAVVPPPPPAEALIEAACGMPLAELASRPAASNPSSGSSPRLEVRRLSPSVLAFRSSPHDGWAVIRSHTPLELHVVEDLEKLPPMMQDLPAELTVASAGEAASSTMH